MIVRVVEQLVTLIGNFGSSGEESSVQFSDPFERMVTRTNPPAAASFVVPVEIEILGAERVCWLIEQRVANVPAASKSVIAKIIRNRPIEPSSPDRLSRGRRLSTSVQDCFVEREVSVNH